MDHVRIFKDSVSIDRWVYDKPTLLLNNNNEIILIFQYSFGPLEWWQWGIDAQGKFFQQYQWCENDLYEDESFKNEISKNEILDKIQHMQSFYKKYNLSEYVNLYAQIERFVLEKY
ncbi:MAG: hypothetical protein U0L26_02010 [Cellulosilyticum sp.]|nr:hypothetical protein [Cellulosilyticum sp.]